MRSGSYNLHKEHSVGTLCGDQGHVGWGTLIYTLSTRTCVLAWSVSVSSECVSVSSECVRVSC